MTEIAPENDTVKIGARALDDASLTNLLPNWRNIYGELEHFREQSDISLEALKANSDQEFYNVISILGKRGSGKSSVLLSVKERLENKLDKSHNDIILPLILPDKMSEINDVLGWIIGFIEKQIKEELKPPKNSISGCCKQSKNDLAKALIELKRVYYQRKEEYQKIILQNFSGNTEYIADKSDVLSSDLDLIVAFRQVVNIALEERSKGGVGKKPLLIIFFDDVDISAGRCPEILKTILTYLTHPQIVTFVSGDLDVFSEVLTVNFLYTEHLLEHNLMLKSYAGGRANAYNSALELRKDRAVEYLKKIMPPAYRFSLEPLTSKQKKRFGYVVNEEKKESLYDLIDKILDGTNITVGMCETILPDNPRSLINVLYYLSSKKDVFEKKQESKGSGDVILQKKNFLDGLLSVLIESNEKFKQVKNNIKRLIATEQFDNSLKIRWKIDFEYLTSLSGGLNVEGLRQSFPFNPKQPKYDQEIARVDQQFLVIDLVVLGVFFRESIKKLLGDEYFKETEKNLLSDSINKLYSSSWGGQPFAPRLPRKVRIAPNEKPDFLLSLYTRFLKGITKFNNILDENSPELNVLYLAAIKEAKRINNDSFAEQFESWYYSKDNKEWVEQVVTFLYKINATDEAEFKKIFQSSYTSVLEKDLNVPDKITFQRVLDEKTIYSECKNLQESSLNIWGTVFQAFCSAFPPIDDDQKINKMFINSLRMHVDMYENYRQAIDEYNDMGEWVIRKQSELDTHINQLKDSMGFLNVTSKDELNVYLNGELENTFLLVNNYRKEFQKIIDSTKDIWEGCFNNNAVRIESVSIGVDTRLSLEQHYYKHLIFDSSKDSSLARLIDNSAITIESSYIRILWLKRDVKLSESHLSAIESYFLSLERMKAIEDNLPRGYYQRDMILKSQRLQEEKDSLSTEIEEKKAELKHLKDTIHAYKTNLLNTSYEKYLNNDTVFDPNALINNLSFRSVVVNFIADMEKRTKESRNEAKVFGYLNSIIEQFDCQIRSYLIVDEAHELVKPVNHKNVISALVDGTLLKKFEWFSPVSEELKHKIHVRLERRLAEQGAIKSEKSMLDVFYYAVVSVLDEYAYEYEYEYEDEDEDEYEYEYDRRIVLNMLTQFVQKNYRNYSPSFSRKVHRVKFIDDDNLENIRFYFEDFLKFKVKVKYLFQTKISKSNNFDIEAKKALKEYRTFFDQFFVEKTDGKYFVDAGFIGFLKKVQNGDYGVRKQS